MPLSDLPPDADPIGLDEYTDDVMLAELLARAKDRARRTPSPAATQMVTLLNAAVTLLLTRQEPEHADR